MAAIAAATYTKRFVFVMTVTSKCGRSTQSLGSRPASPGSPLERPNHPSSDPARSGLVVSLRLSPAKVSGAPDPVNLRLRSGYQAFISQNGNPVTRFGCGGGSRIALAAPPGAQDLPLTYAFAPRPLRRSRWGMTVYLGSRADWKPALKMLQRTSADPASISAPPAAAAARRRPKSTISPAPAPVHALESLSKRPASPFS